MQFIALYKFYYQDLYAYGVSLGFNTEDVKDAIQEVYLKLYFNERLCIDEKKIKFYLLRSVRNQLIDWERTKIISFRTLFVHYLKNLPGSLPL